MASWRVVRALEAKKMADKSAAQHKTADRPHRWTVMSWFLSPLVAAASIFFSVWMSNRSMRISDMSMRVGQRAYVTVSNSQMAVHLPWETAPSPSESAFVYITFDINNLGNTPADIGDITLKFHVNPKWKPREDEVMKENGSVGPKAVLHRHLSTSFVVSDSLARILRVPQSANNRLLSPPRLAFEDMYTHHFQMRGQFLVTDAFGEKHDVSWCSAASPLRALGECRDGER